MPFFLTPVIVACALFMENLDSTVLSTSLPAIAADLHEDPIQLKLALTSYLLALAIFIPASGWMADRFGAKTVFRAAIVVFTIGSICCGLSSTLPQFVAARILQGAGGAMMTPVGRLVLLRAVPREQLVRALAWLTTPALIGPVIGPPLGGFITTYFHWRWIFWINVPIGLIGVVLVSLYIDNIKEEAVPPLDIVGFGLSGVGLSCLMFGFSVLGRGFLPGWQAGVLIAVGLAAMLLYLRHARRTPFPILDLSLLRRATFRASVGGGFLFRIGLGASPFLLPLLFQAGFGLTAFQSGMLTFLSTLGAMAMKPTAAPILRFAGFRTVLIANAVISTAFFCGSALFTPQTSHFVIAGVLLVGGFFRSLQFTALNAVAYADIDNREMSRATSLASVGQQLSLSVGVTLGAAVLDVARGLHAGPLRASDFAPAFLLVAAISLSSLLFFRPLPADAGAEMSGRQVRARTRPATGLESAPPP